MVEPSHTAGICLILMTASWGILECARLGKTKSFLSVVSSADLRLPAIPGCGVCVFWFFFIKSMVESFKTRGGL